MQVLRQSLAIAIQRPAMLVRPTAILQQVRFDGSDPRSSTSSESHKGGRQSDSTRGSDLNKSKGGDKKPKSTTTDDTKQPGSTRKDWSDSNEIDGNTPSYGKAGSTTDTHNPDRGKK